MYKPSQLIFPFLISAISIILVNGCSQEAAPDNKAKTTKADPPVPVAPAGPVIISEQDIHERLKKDNPDYQNNAEFGKEKGIIISAKLIGVEDISALKALKL
ncbi:MAG TPA: hypothetical protein DDZ90_11345, partial [Planctomycetaceae bacterium]|nr:hypothetical protein [Planctomycetaceae bacterium]